MRPLFFLTTLALSTPAWADGMDHDAAMSLLKTGDTAGAVKAYRSLTKADPDDARAWFMLGTVELQRGRAKKAVGPLQRALDEGWYPAVGAYNLACAHAQNGDLDAAFEALDTALNAGYQDAGHIAKDTDLAPLHGHAGWAARVDHAARNQQPCSFEEAYRAFDFWLGSWAVFDARGTQVGTNTISAVEGTCALEEHWTSALGSTGRSFSYLDPADGQWHQDWIASSGSVIHYAGGIDAEGAMVLEGTNASPTSEPAPSKCVWTPEDDGTVTQSFYGQNDDGAWTLNGRLTYRRLED